MSEHALKHDRKKLVKSQSKGGEKDTEIKPPTHSSVCRVISGERGEYGLVCGAVAVRVLGGGGEFSGASKP